MKVEREIAWFSLPFAAGAVTAVYAADMPAISTDIFSALSAWAAAICMTYILNRSGNTGDKTFSLASSVFLSFICGILTGFTGHMRQISSPETPGQLWARLTAIGRHMGTHIDMLPFSSSGTNALIKALLTGDRGDLPRETVESFRASGASHILALSGMHLGIIYMMISRCLSFAGNYPAAARIRSILTISLCGIYTGATGAGPSIVRAYIFILYGEAARLSGRRATTAGIMLGSLALQLMVSPLSAKSIGFQLSYAAMAGIAFIYPKLKKLRVGGPLRRIWNPAALSISCQLTAGPVAFLYFGTFPRYFLLTNLIALPLASLIIPLALLSLGLSSAGACPDFLIQTTEKAAGLLTSSLAIIAGM